jgi:hypothetical protein
MQNENRRISYVRTLVFTIVSALLSIALFSLIFVKGSRDWLLFIIITEIGIFSIIIYCIIAIINREKKIQEMRDPKNYVIKFDNCPDYYVKRYDTSSKGYFCSNEYVVVDPRNTTKKLIMKLFPENDNSSPPYHSSDFKVKNGTGPLTDPQPSDKFMIEDMLSKITTNDERCQVVNPNLVEKSTDKLKGFKSLPWTSVQKRCDTLYSKN